MWIKKARYDGHTCIYIYIILLYIIIYIYIIYPNEKKFFLTATVCTDYH